MTDTVLAPPSAPLGSPDPAPAPAPAPAPSPAPEPVAVETPPAPATDGKPATQEAPTLLDAPKAEGMDGFDWRAGMSRGDAKKAAVLSRFKDLGTLADAFFSAQEKIRKGVPSAPGEGATPEEVAAYRQTLGVPDKPDAYEFAGEFSDAEKPAINTLKTVAHEANFTPQQMNALAKWYDGFRQEATAAQIEANNRAVSETRQALIDEMGARDFERNALLANQFMKDRGVDDIAHLRLENGVKLGAHPQFVKLMMTIANEGASDALVAAVDAPGNSSVDDRLNDLYKLRSTDERRYGSKEVQDEILRLESIKAERARRKAA